MGKAKELGKELEASKNSIGSDRIDATSVHRVGLDSLKELVVNMKDTIKSSKSNNDKVIQLLEEDKKLRDMLDNIPQIYRNTKYYLDLKSIIGTNKIDTTISCYSVSGDYDATNGYEYTKYISYTDYATNDPSKKFRKATDEDITKVLDKFTFKINVVLQFLSVYESELAKVTKGYDSIIAKVEDYNDKINRVLIDLLNILPQTYPKTNEELELICDSIGNTVRGILSINESRSKKGLEKEYKEALDMLSKYQTKLSKYAIINPSEIPELKLSYGKSETCYYVTKTNTLILKVMPNILKVPNIVKAIKDKEIEFIEVGLNRGESFKLFDIAYKNREKYMDLIHQLRSDLKDAID